MQQMIAILTWAVVIGFAGLSVVMLATLATHKRDLAQRDQRLHERLDDLARMREIIERAWSLSRWKP